MLLGQFSDVVSILSRFAMTGFVALGAVFDPLVLDGMTNAVDALFQLCIDVRSSSVRYSSISGEQSPFSTAAISRSMFWTNS